LGNLLPALFCVPLLVIGLIRFRPEDPFGMPSLACFVAFPIVGWLALNFLGFFGNGWMKRELARRLGFTGTRGPERFFVGIARPSFRSALDAHEDVGYLVVHPDRLEFVGETVRVTFPREDVRKVRIRWNPHSWVLLGRWIAVEGVAGDRPIRLSIEPRERATLLGNLFYSEKLIARLREWASTS